ncbi:MAG TPA: sugar transferase [Blastocatellia bacterium]|jgi:lipopolysaccharide/colanic/teichoic acid biosynthesis glycosyltransferase/glycosyltransferase involved in cell wall biosynthesis
MIKVLLIHQAFASPDEPGGTRHYELARHCVREGLDFTIVASNLSYLTGRRAVEGEEAIAEQHIDGVRVLRAYIYPSLHRSFFWRVVSFISFMLASVKTAFRAGDVDLVMGTSPPIFQAVSAWVVAAVRRRPFLLEIRDLWPEFAVDMGVLKNPALVGLSRLLERFLYARATHLLVNSPAYRDYLIGKGIPATKISFVPNGVDPDMFDPSLRGERIRREFDLAGKFVMTYAGALGIANDIQTVLRAAGRLREQPEFHFLLVGDGKERGNLERLARELRLTNVTFAGSRPKSEMAEILAASDACVATLKDIAMFRMTYPNKIFDYMAAARPTILAIDGVIREVVESAGGGIFVPPGDDAALAEAARRLREDRPQAERMGRSARAFVVERFNRRQQAAVFLHLIRRLAAGVGASKKFGFYRRAGKRLFDLVLSLLALILLSPLLVMLALLVRVKLGSPALFRQRRPGLNGRPFTLMKFRTMTDARDANGHLLPDSERLTSFGRFLRSTSLDELPELFSVLKGEMSLVGPRPLLMEYLDRYSAEEARRHEAKPGITGWAQINGRNAISWEERFKLDVEYVDGLSLGFDLKVIWLTLIKILRREGISAEGHSTMPVFTGSRGKDR